MRQVSIAAAGAIPPLVRLLEAGTDGIIDRAAGALRILAVNDDNQVMTFLCFFFRAVVLCCAVSTLMATHLVRQVSIAAAGAIPPLVKRLASGDDFIEQQAAGVLWHLAYNNAHNMVIVDAWFIPLH